MNVPEKCQFYPKAYSVENFKGVRPIAVSKNQGISYISNQHHSFNGSLDYPIMFRSEFEFVHLQTRVLLKLLYYSLSQNSWH